MYSAFAYIMNKLYVYAAAAAKSLQSCPTLCDPIDGSPPGSPIPGILQERTLEWGAISFSNAWKWKVKAKSNPPDYRWMYFPFAVCSVLVKSLNYSEDGSTVFLL